MDGSSLRRCDAVGMAKIPQFNDVSLVPLISDEDVVDRVAGLIDSALSRQVWLMFLDEEHRQSPVLMPSYLPERPGAADADSLAHFLEVVMAEIEAATVVLTYERPGSSDLDAGDIAWLRTLRASCLSAEISFRGPLLCHDDGVRWVPADDYL